MSSQSHLPQIRIEEMCEMFGDKLPTVAVMRLLCHDNASKSGKWDNVSFLHCKARSEWSILLLWDLRTVCPTKQWAVNWAADLGQWAMVAPSFISTKEQLRRVIQTLCKMNHFSFSLVRFEKGKTLASWILNLTVSGLQRAMWISQEQSQKHPE